MASGREIPLLERLARSLLLICLAAGLPAGCAPEPGAVQQAISTPSQGAEQTPVEIKGRLEPRQFVDLGTSLPGRVKEVLVAEGQPVAAGQALFRLDSYPQLVADKIAAEQELLLAQQALDELNRNAGVAQAQANRRLKQAERTLALAQDRLASLEKPVEQARIDQAQANLLLSTKRLADARDDLRKAQKKYANKTSLLWLFVNRHAFGKGLTLLEQAVAVAERHYWDARQKYEDLLAPADEIDLAIARAKLSAAQASRDDAQREAARLAHGPDPDDLEAARSRIQAAEAGLAAARSALRAAEVVAPLSGVVVDLEIKPGEWAQPGQRLVVVADLSQWVVETTNLKEAQVVNFEVGQPVSLSLDAYPQQALSGQVESISLYSDEQDDDVFYTVRIDLEENLALFRWGMTARMRLK